MAAPWNPVDVPEYFPDLFDEVAIVSRWQTARRAHEANVGALYQTDPKTGKNGFERLNEIAMVGPSIAPYAVGLARAGVDPATSNLPAFVAQQSEIMRREQHGMPAFGGIARPGAGTNVHAHRYRLRNALDAANAIGLVDPSGRLVEPESTDMTDPRRWLFEDLRGAFMGAMLDMPYTDRMGHERTLKWSNSPTYAGGTNSQQIFRQMEAAEEPLNELKADYGFNTFDQIARKLPNGSQLLAEAKQLGLLDRDGFLIDERVKSGQEFDQEAQRTRTTFTTRAAQQSWYDNLEQIADQSDVTLASIAPEGLQTRKPGGFWEKVGDDKLPARREAPSGPLDKVTQPIRDVQAAGVAGGGPEWSQAGIGEQVTEGFRRTSQLAGVAMNAPLQEATGQVRNIYAAATNRGNPDFLSTQSDLGIAISTGDFSSFGGGYTVDPESKIAKQRVEREAQRGQIDGHNLTVGRIVAQPFGDADSAPFDFVSGLVDFGWAIYADPSTYVLKGAGKVGQSRHLIRPGGAALADTGLAAERQAATRLDDINARVSEVAQAPSGTLQQKLGFEDVNQRIMEPDSPPPPPDAQVRRAAGAMDAGITRWVHRPTAEQAINGVYGRAVVNLLADADNPAELARKTNYKWDPELYVAIADETDPALIRNMIFPLLGSRIRNLKSEFQGMGTMGKLAEHSPIVGRSGPSKSLTWARWMAEVPENQVDISDKLGTVRTVQNYGQTIRMPQADIDAINSAILRAQSGGEVDAALAAWLRKADGILDRHGIANPETRNNMVQQAEQLEDMRLWYADEIGSSTPTWDGALIDEDFVRAGTALDGHQSPHLAMVSTDGIRHLPDVREMKRMTSNPALRFMTTKHSIWDTEAMKGDLRFPLMLFQAFQEALWKPVTLARLAWTIRVVGEEQLRMAGTPGIDSLFSHPLSYIGTRLHFKNDVDIFGNPISLSRRHKEAMMTRRGGLLDDIPDRVRSNRKTTIYTRDSGDYGYNQSWGTEIVRMYRDPISNHLANAGTLDETLDWLRRGEGRRFVEKLAFQTGVDYTDDAVLRAYLQRVQNRMTELSGGDNDLLSAMATGTYNGKSVLSKNGMFLNKNFVSALESRKFTVGPEKIVGEVYEKKKYTGDLARIEEAKDKAVDFLFTKLMSNRTNNLSRSPYFRQEYWRRMTELAPYAEDQPALRAAFQEASTTVRAAEDVTFINKRLHRKFTYDFDHAVPDPRAKLSMDEMDMIAKDYALQATKRRLFDLSSKKNWEDTMRLISPFISAWKEVFTSWGRLVKENPSVVRRGFQGYDAAVRSGVFYKDETTGEMIFTYPGSEFVNKFITGLAGGGGGVPIPTTGQAGALSFMSQIVPGVGPAAQIPVSLLMSNKPQWRDLYTKLVPFGGPAEEGLYAALNPLNYAPPWMKRLAQVASKKGGQLVGKDWEWGMDSDERVYGNSVGQVMRYLASTGEYDLDRPEEWQRLQDDAMAKADMWYLIRSVGAMTLPAAPAPRWLSETKSGDLIPIAVITERYQELRKEDFTTADEKMLAEFGDEIVLSLVPFSRTLSWGIDPSEEFHEWALEHPQLKRDYPQIYGLFGPTGKFDIGVFNDQLSGDERDELSNKEWTNFAQHILAERLYQKERNLFGEDADSEENADYLRQYRDYLHETYPGWRNFTGQEAGPELRPAMGQLRRAMNDPDLKDNPTMVATRQYMEQRDEYFQFLQEEDIANSFRAEAAEPERNALLAYGQRLVDEHPEFERMFDMVLSRELEADEE